MLVKLNKSQFCNMARNDLSRKKRNYYYNDADLHLLNNSRKIAKKTSYYNKKKGAIYDYE